VVVGIDRKSGKPLQSHAKAPFMATFRIRKERTDPDAIDDTSVANAPEIDNSSQSQSHTGHFEVWQSAIFKVGDDCRQDILALQMIAAFRGIFHSVGLDVYVFPYRVTATAPGCGVIDVLPNSISRDMLGREAVNGLYEYFINKYGSEESTRFQEARANFVKSMAAYSVISYLLQFKDRHNGNIMIDDAGHILHIDFGFCFDIAPGGIRFERAPFKLTGEMIAVMGGSNPPSQSFRWFEELCVKAFLACRQHAEHLIQIVSVMLDSGLPCFKPQTIQHLRERFRVDGPWGTGYVVSSRCFRGQLRTELKTKTKGEHISGAGQLKNVWRQRKKFRRALPFVLCPLTFVVALPSLLCPLYLCLPLSYTF
jgi:phosphatidylinositol 4-kinase A